MSKKLFDVQNSCLMSLFAKMSRFLLCVAIPDMFMFLRSLLIGMTPGSIYEVSNMNSMRVDEGRNSWNICRDENKDKCRTVEGGQEPGS